jgi:PAS domain S-box-containing protein
MDTTNTYSSSPDTDWAALLAAERARREQAEAALATTSAQLAALEHQLAATASSAQRHQTQLAALVRNLQVGMILVDDTGQIQFVNQYFWELFGLPPVVSPLEGGPPVPFAAVYIDNAFQDPAAFTARAWAMHNAGETVLQEEFLLADGRVVELDYLVLDHIGAGRLICYRDVTERRRREDQLQTLSYIPEQTPNPILRLNAGGELVYANPAAAPLLHDLIAETDGEMPQHLLAMVHSALQNPVEHQQELTVAGQHYLFTAVAVPGQAYATLYLTNITARQQAEQQLAKQQAFYEAILDQVSTAVAVFNDEHRYLFLNPMVDKDPATRAWILGKTNEEACAYRGRPAAIAQQRAARFAQAVREQQEVSWEEDRTGPDGQPQRMLMRYRPVRGADGQLWVISSGVDITERRQTEEKMARQQEFYESILNQLPVDVAVFDADHRFLFVNPSSISDPEVRRKIIGLNNDEYFQIRQKYQPEGLANQRRQYFELAVRTRTDVTWEEMRTDRHGRPQLIVRHLRPVFDADEQLRMVVGSGIDITARYTAEKLQHQVQVMLQTQQSFIRHIVDSLPNVLYMVDPDGSISFSNKAFEDLISRSTHHDPKGMSAVAASELLQIQVMNEEVWKTRQDQTRELPFTLATGETMHFQVHKRTMQRADGKLGILTVSTDVTAVKQARHELERREKQYRDLVYYSQALICTHDLEGHLLSVNPAIERLMGMSAELLVGRHLREALLPKHHAALEDYLKGNEPLQMEDRIMEIRTWPGERRYLRYYTYQVNEEGFAPYVVASGYDVTEVVLAQRALQQAKQEAEENALAKEAFLARMSHEIRTPLNGVLGMAALLQKTSLTAPQREYLNTMQHAGRHLLALLNDVLDMAKITANHLQLNHAPFDR